MTQYLSNFLLQLSVVMEPLHQLSHKDPSWDWSPEHDATIATVKQLITNAPVLRYFDPILPVTLQCDSCPFTTGPTHSMWNMRSYTNRKKLCSNRKGDTGHCLWL